MHGLAMCCHRPLPLVCSTTSHVQYNVVDKLYDGYRLQYYVYNCVVDGTKEATIVKKRNLSSSWRSWLASVGDLSAREIGIS